jgi:SRSO17 transposase
MRYLNELILKGGVKCVSLLLAISIDSNHMMFFFFFMHANVLAELVLKRVEDIVRMSFSTQYAICIFYIHIFVWLSCRPLFFATKNVCFFFF